MKKIILGVAAIALLFFVGPQVNADDTMLVVKGNILNADGTPYSKNQSAWVTFTPLDSLGKQNSWEGYFALATPGALPDMLHLGKDGFSSAMFSWLKMNPVQYRAVAKPYSDVATGSSAAMQDIESEPQVVDLRTAQGTVSLQFQFLQPHKFITGTIVDDLGQPIAGTYDATNRLYNARVFIRVSESPALYSSYRDYSVMPDAEGRFTIAVGNHGGYYTVYPASDTPDKYMRNIGNAVEGAFQDNTTDETITVALSLTRAGSSVIRGRLVDSLGKPFGSLTVNGKPTQSAAMYADVVGRTVGQFMNISSDGLFSVKVPAGDYQLSFFAQKSGPGGGGEYITYPSLAASVQDGQTVDLGDIKPTYFLENDPLSPNAPQVVDVAGSRALFNQTKSKVKSVMFVETFADQSHYNTKASNGVSWSSSGVTIQASATSVKAQAVTSGLVSGTVVSKSFGPRGGKITTAKLLEYHQVTGTGAIQYAISADGVHWLDVSAGKKVDVPSSWNTSNGLKWRAVLQKSSSVDTVAIKGLKVELTSLASVKKPSVSSVKVVAKSLQSQVTVKGKNFTGAPVVYVGTVKVSGVKVKSGVLTFTLKRSKIPKSSYTVTVVTPDLQSAVKTKVNLRRTTK